MTVSRRRHRRAGRAVRTLMAALLLSVLLGPALMQALVRQGLEAVLASRGMQAELRTFRFDPFSGRFRLRGLGLHGPQGAEAGVSSLSGRIDPGALLDRRILVSRLRVDGLWLVVRRTAGGWQVAGLDLPASRKAPRTAPGAGTWTWDLRDLELSEAGLRLVLPGQVLEAGLDHASLRRSAAGAAFELDLAGHALGAALEFSGRSGPGGDLSRWQGEVRWQGVPLGPLAAAAGLGGREAAGRADLQGRLDWATPPEAPLEARYSGRLAVHRPGLRAAGTLAAASTLRWQGEISLHGGAGRLEGAGEGELRLAGLRLEPGGTRVAAAQIRWQGRHRWVRAGADGVSWGLEGTLDLDRPRWHREGAAVSAAAARWSGSLRSGGGDPQAAVPMVLEGEAAAEDLELAGTGLRARAGELHWQGTAGTGPGGARAAGSLDFAAVGVEWPGRAGGAPVIAVSAGAVHLPGLRLDPGARLEGALRAQDLELGVAAAGEGRSAARIAILELDPSRWVAGAGVELGRLRLQGIGTGLRRDAAGRWQPLDRLREALGAGARTGAGAGDGRRPRGALPWRLAGIELVDGSLDFEDRSTQPVVTSRVRVARLELGSVASTAPGRPSELRLQGRIGDYASLQLEGSLQPLLRPVGADLRLRLRGLELPPYNGYLVPLLGYRARAGQLDLTGDLAVREGELRGEQRVTLRGLDLEPADPALVAAFEQRLSMPLESALALLRDRHDRVRLEVAVSGRLEDPDFDLSDAIDQALVKALRWGAVAYLKQAFQPYGALITVLQLAGKAAAAIRLDPVAFAPGASALDARARAYLQKVAAVLEDRPRTHIRLCGHAVPADLPPAAPAGPAAEAPAAAPETAAGRTGPPRPAAAERDRRLRDLARQRARAVRDLLVTVHGIAPARVLVCAPELDRDPEARPRVELTL